MLISWIEKELFILTSTSIKWTPTLSPSLGLGVVDFVQEANLWEGDAMGIQKIRCEGKTWQIFNYSRTQVRGKPTITFTMNWKQFLYSDNSTKHVTLETQDIMCPQHMCPRHILNNNSNYKTRDKDKEYKVDKHCLSNGIPPSTDPTTFFSLSLTPRIPHICHGHHGRCPWRKNLSCGEICPHDRLSFGKNSPHMINVKKIWNVEK